MYIDEKILLCLRESHKSVNTICPIFFSFLSFPNLAVGQKWKRSEYQYSLGYVFCAEIARASFRASYWFNPVLLVNIISPIMSCAFRIYFQKATRLERVERGIGRATLPVDLMRSLRLITDWPLPKSINISVVKSHDIVDSRVFRYILFLVMFITL